MKPFRVIIALGGNALLKRGQENTAYNLNHNLHSACVNIAKVMKTNGCLVKDGQGFEARRKLEVVITHGNGPQVGLLAMQAMSFKEHMPFDCLVSETEGMIGYAVERHLMNQFPLDSALGQLVTLITQVEVSPDDPAFKDPTKFIGPVWTTEEAHEYSRKYGWHVRQDGAGGMRRVVPSPYPIRFLEMEAIRILVDKGLTVICAGGGGIPVSYRVRENEDYLGDWVGEEAVVDKDHSSALLAHELEADALYLLSDVECVYESYNKPFMKPIPYLNANKINLEQFPAGSMRPKVEAACNFVVNAPPLAPRHAMIGSIEHLPELLLRHQGTVVAAE